MTVPRTWTVATGRTIDAASDKWIRLDAWGPPAKHHIDASVTADWALDLPARVFQTPTGKYPNLGPAPRVGQAARGIWVEPRRGRA